MIKKLILVAIVLSSSVQGQPVSQFDEQRAFFYLQKQCDFGPRNPGSEGHQKCRDFLVAELQKYAAHVKRQDFQYPIRSGKSPVLLTNIIASFYPENPRRLLLCAHWDTRPWADQDPFPQNRSRPVPGANDGASGVAILLEIARVIHSNPPPFGIDIILFDGEDFGTYGDNESWAIGAKEFARRKSIAFNPMFGILLDMVGDKDQQIYIERNSMNYAPDVVNKIWQKAEQLGIPEFIPEPKFEVMDDHLRLLNAGIPCVDIIDFDYKFWHTIDDTPRNCSPRSLGNVGRVVLAVIYDR